MNAKLTYVAAVLVLMVFFLNTLISTACAMSSIVHVAHHHSGSTDHNRANTHHHHHGNPGSSHNDTAGDDCCSISMVAFNQQDKLIASNIQTTPPGFTFLYTIPVSEYADTHIRDISNKGISHFIRRRQSSTIPDLRIVIQSFQI